MIKLPIARLNKTIERLDLQLKEQRTEAMNVLIRATNTIHMHDDGNWIKLWANKALKNMVSELSSMSEGGRNNTAFKFGASMGNMASAGMIDAMVAESALIQAAIASGLSHYESRAVSRGMQRGMQTPFDTSKLSKKNDNKYWLDRDSYKDYIEALPAEEPIEYELYDSELLPGGRKSWINQERLPKSWIQAMLTLSGSTSKVTTLFIKLHHAFQIGSLNPNNFTLKQIRDTFYDKKRRDSTSSALQTLINLKVVRVNGAYSIYKEMPNKPLQLEIIGNPTLIGLNFLDMLDRYILEQHTDKDIAPRLHTLFDDLDISLDEAKTWHDRCESLVSAETAYKIDADQRYWLEELTGDNRYEELDYDVDDDNLSLRTKLLTEFLNKQVDNEIPMSQPEIMRLCGLKSASFKALYKEASIATDLRYRWHSVKNPNSCNLKQELSAATQAKNNDGRGGHLVWMTIKPVGGKYGKPIYKHAEMLSRWEQLKSGDEDKPTIFGINIRVQLPSLVRFKTEQELAEEIKAEKQVAQEESIVILPAIEASEQAQADIEETPVIADKTRKPRYSSKQDRSWSSHDKLWLHKQLAAEMYCWLNEDLDKSGLVGASNVIRYINEQVLLHDIDKPFHTAETFFDSEPLDFGVTEMPEEKEIEEAPIEPLPTIDNPKTVRTKRRLTLAESRAWGTSRRKQAYLESIGVK